MWEKPLKELEKVDNPTSTKTDETEDETNELVILDDADNWFSVSFVTLPFYLFLVNSSK